MSKEILKAITVTNNLKSKMLLVKEQNFKA